MFNYFPYIYYNNEKATHILLKEQVVQKYTQDYTKFFQYTVKEGERADIIAYNQYGDSTLDWIIYLINNVIDPYKDWVLDSEQFAAYLESKYNTTADRLSSTLIDSSIAYYYYAGISTDSPETIASYNYTMTPFTYESLGSPAGWVAKSIYDYEFEINEGKRDITLLIPFYIEDFKQQFKDLMING